MNRNKIYILRTASSRVPDQREVILKLLVVVPTYNEAENLPELLSRLFKLPLEGLHVLIVDDNSPDKTGELAEKMRQDYPGRLFVLHRTGKLGLGTAYITGFRYGLENGYDLIGQMDADFSHEPEKLLQFADALRAEHDLAIGSRYIPGGSLDDRWPAWRKFLSGFGNFYARTILGIPIRDVTGGYRLWERSLLERLPLERVKSNGYVFQVEMAYLAIRSGCSYLEIPIHFAERVYGKSKMSVKIQLEAAINVWRLLWVHHKNI